MHNPPASPLVITVWYPYENTQSYSFIAVNVIENPYVIYVIIMYNYRVNPVGSILTWQCVFYDKTNGE